MLYVYIWVTPSLVPVNTPENIKPTASNPPVAGMGMALGMILMLFLAPTAEAYWSVDYTITGARASWTADSIPGLGLPTYLSYTFSADPTSVQADACPPGYYSYDDAQTCTACPSGKYSSTPTASSVDTCIACESGKYSGTVGANSSSTCINCPNATYFAGTAGTSLAVCLACPANSSSYPGSKLLQACVCLPGFAGPNGGSCSICNPPDWYGTPPGDGGMNFGGDGSSTPTTTFWCLFGQANTCPMHSTAGLGASSLAQCLCNPGYYGDPSMGGPELTLCQVQALFALFFSSSLPLLLPPSLPTQEPESTRVTRKYPGISGSCWVPRPGGRAGLVT